MWPGDHGPALGRALEVLVTTDAVTTINPMIGVKRRPRCCSSVLQEQQEVQAHERIDVVSRLVGSFPEQRNGELQLHRGASPAPVASPEMPDLRRDERPFASIVLAVEFVELAEASTQIKGMVAGPKEAIDATGEAPKQSGIAQDSGSSIRSEHPIAEVVPGLERKNEAERRTPTVGELKTGAEVEVPGWDRPCLILGESRCREQDSDNQDPPHRDPLEMQDLRRGRAGTSASTPAGSRVVLS